ncbi:hypothetical protein HELRODRAFT_98385, partial [Helobdella robusta]|uniref:Hairy/enhancer-of-split related with YRPW motif protein n=1 Tax=Helobdella robusta TaxID=6412 RepID=T1G9M2_HELRO
MKRRLHDRVDYDDDALTGGDDDDDSYSLNGKCTGSPTQSCLIPDRKKRRGIIEKKRRDRINQCLMELKRLVPAAFEKQGSTKLEKAEILKMTVDHLKMTQATTANNSTSSNNINKDKKFCKGGLIESSASTSVNYKLLGYHECASEVARYLTTYEGLGSQDPLCVRLLNHLNYYVTQQQQHHQQHQQHHKYNHHQLHVPKLHFQHTISNNNRSSLLSVATSENTQLQVQSGLGYWDQPPTRPIANRPY